MMKKTNKMTATDFHTEISGVWDDKYIGSSDFQEREQVWQKMFNQILTGDEKVIDVGCGAGIFSFFLADKGHEVIGIDGSEGMIERCEEKLKKRSDLQLTFTKQFLPFSKGVIQKYKGVDLVFASSVLEYIDNLNGILDQFDELLNPGGSIAFSLPNEESWYRVIERMVYNTISIPKYLQYVKTTGSISTVKQLMEGKGYELTYHTFYAGNFPGANLLNKVMPPNKVKNLFLVVFRKRN